MKIPLDQITPNPEQPRTHFDPAELDSLAGSLKEHGQLNSIAVEGPHDGIYILLDGEKRWRAAQIAGWSEIEANVRAPLNGSVPTDRLLLAMIGNSQRSDIGPIDEAKLYKRLRDMGFSAEEIGRKAGRNVSNIFQRLRLLEFTPELQTLINQRKLPISVGVFDALRKLEPDQANIVARRAAAGQFTEKSIKALCAWVKRDKRITLKRLPATEREITQGGCPPVDLNKPLVGAYKIIFPILQATCQDCGMSAGNGVRTICTGCPLTDFVKRIGKEEK